MDYKFFFSELKNIITNPAQTWDETKSLRRVRDSFLLPMAMLVSLSAFSGSLMFSNSELSAAYSVLVGIRSFVVLVTTVYLVSLIMVEVTYPLDLGRDFTASFTIVTFSFAPFLLCQIISNIFESLLFVNIIGAYGLFVFWEGAEKYLNPPSYKKMPLLVATAITAVIVYVSANMFLKTIFDRIYYMIFD